MNDRPALEGHQRLAALGLGVVGQTVGPVLLHGSLGRLGEVGLQFHGSHRQPVDEEHQIDRQLARWVILELGHYPQSVGGIALEHVRVAMVLGGGLGEIDVTAPGDREAASQ
jgi:hypothetical protein